MLDLHNSVREGNAKLIRQCLDSGVDVNAKNRLGETALVYADYESPEILEILVSAGANVNAPDRHGQCPLHLAVEQAAYKSVRLLLTAGAQVDAENSCRKTALQLAVKYGMFKIVKRLIEAGADTTRPLTLHKAEHRQLIEYLEKAGAEVSVASDRAMSALALVKSMSAHAFWHCIAYPERGVNAYDSEGFTYLHLAAFRGNLPHVRYLLDSAGADLHKPTNNPFRQTALHVAAALSTAVDNCDVIEFLIERGADVAATDSKGNTPLHVLCARGRAANTPKVARLLLDRGACATAKSKDGKTPLHAVMAWDSLREPCEVAKLLLTRGASMHAPDKQGISAFDYALRRQSLPVLRLLLDQCDDAVWSRTLQDQTTLHMATENPNAEVLQCLIDRGVDVNAKTKLGYTPLHYAVKRGNHAACEVLLRNGADVECASGNGTTPLLGAVAADDVTAFELLLDFGADLYAKGADGRSCFATALKHGSHAMKMAAVQYAAILASKDKPMSESDEKLMRSLSMESYHFDLCAVELHRMDLWKFYDKGVSFLDLLVADREVLADYARDARLVMSFDFTREGFPWDLHNFPVYYRILCDRFDAEVSHQKPL